MQQIRAQLTYANVMAAVAVFIALGGASYAATQLPKNSVGSKQIKKNAVVAAKVKNGAITAAKLGASSVTGEKLAADAVTAAKLADGSVTTSALANLGVTTGKLANNAVGTGKLDAAAVNTGKLADNAVTTPKIADDAVTGAKTNESSLHFTCNAGGFQLPGGGLCAKVSGGLATFWDSINVCRGTATGGTLPTVAEFAAIAAVTGSPFRGIVVWTSDVMGGLNPTGAIVTSNGAGEVTTISQTELTKSPTTTTACVYDPALAPS